LDLPVIARFVFHILIYLKRLLEVNGYPFLPSPTSKLGIAMDDTNQAESSKISTSLELEQIEVNLFRSKTLFMPTKGRGVFGGQVISQAIVAATNSIDPVFGLHVRTYLFWSGAEIDGMLLPSLCT